MLNSEDFGIPSQIHPKKCIINPLVGLGVFYLYFRLQTSMASLNHDDTTISAANEGISILLYMEPDKRLVE